MKYSKLRILIAGLVCIWTLQLLPGHCVAQPLNKKEVFTHQDTLRGSITPERAWWNVLYYNIYVAPDYDSKTIHGFNQISFGIVKPGSNKKMQIDLQMPMIIDSVIFEKKRITSITRDTNVYYIDFGNYDFQSSLSKPADTGMQHNVKIYFHGKPRVAINPPWDGGWIFSKDEKGRPWMTVACQGLGASVWYPCKDHQSDEPDLGATVQVLVPDSLVAVANGRLYSKNDQKDGTTLYTWQVKNPINNYDIIPYIGKYVHWSDEFMGENGRLSLDYWVLDYDLEKSKAQFGRNVKPMLKCFEYWMGPYPFYEDGYKLVESSHLGMEHQSAVAYGNKFMDGYLGMDLSGSGWGLKWDYIIVHESGHEWFGNNITSRDIADMWVHEGFTDYSETLFVDCQDGNAAGDAYTQGLRKNIENHIPIIGKYGVNKEGSEDMYFKGSNLLHTIRQIIDNDSVFRQIWRGLNKQFWHQTVDSKDIEAYITKQSGKDLSKVFDQYLRTIKVPVLEYKINANGHLSYRWNNVIDGFNMPVRMEDNKTWLYPTTSWQELSASADKNLTVDKNFYIQVKKVE